MESVYVNYANYFEIFSYFFFSCSKDGKTLAWIFFLFLMFLRFLAQINFYFQLFFVVKNKWKKVQTKFFICLEDFFSSKENCAETKFETYLELWWVVVEHFELLLLSWVVQHDVLKCSLLCDFVAA